MIFRSIEVGLYFLPRKNLPKPKFDISGAQLILEVAKYVQYLLKFTVNVLEKFHRYFFPRNIRNVNLVCLLGRERTSVFDSAVSWYIG